MVRCTQHQLISCGCGHLRINVSFKICYQRMKCMFCTSILPFLSTVHNTKPYLYRHALLPCTSLSTVSLCFCQLLFFFLTLGRNVTQLNYFLCVYSYRCVLTNGWMQLVNISSWLAAWQFEGWGDDRASRGRSHDKSQKHVTIIKFCAFSGMVLCKLSLVCLVYFFFFGHNYS